MGQQQNGQRLYPNSSKRRERVGLNSIWRSNGTRLCKCGRINKSENIKDNQTLKRIIPKRVMSRYIKIKHMKSKTKKFWKQPKIKKGMLPIREDQFKWLSFLFEIMEAWRSGTFFKRKENNCPCWIFIQWN